MPLPPLPPDPKPSEREIAELISRESVDLLSSWTITETRLAECPPDVAWTLARLGWEADRKRTDPDALRVPFATAVKVFPDGALDYDEYLATPRWRRIRERVLAAAESKCACCPRRATQVHHRDYRPRVLRGQDDTPLVPLCVDCHSAVHK